MASPSRAASTKPEPNWGASRRLQFIEFKAFWDGGVNRGDITETFSVSVPQASADLAKYQSLAPDNLAYDPSEKRYVPTPQFAPRFVQPSSHEYLTQLREKQTIGTTSEHRWAHQLPAVDYMPLPVRPVDREILRQLLAAVRETKSVEVEYYSMNAQSPVDKWRRITPHAFAFDGFRWHVRAWCHRSARFKDFVLSRCCKAQHFGEPGVGADRDDFWQMILEVSLVPNSALTPSQREAVEFDYGMSDGVVHISVRLALLYYFDKYFSPALPERIKSVVSADEARREPVTVRNAAAYTKALRQLGRLDAP